VFLTAITSTQPVVLTRTYISTAGVTVYVRVRDTRFFIRMYGIGHSTGDMEVHYASVAFLFL